MGIDKQRSCRAGMLQVATSVTYCYSPATSSPGPFVKMSTYPNGMSFGIV